MPDQVAFVAKAMGLENEKQRRSAIAASNTNFSAAVPYPLVELKDAMATCADVFVKKGKCRPVVPTTGHPARRLLKRVGQALRPIYYVYYLNEMLFRLRSELFSSAISISLAYPMSSVCNTMKRERNGYQYIYSR